MDEAVVDAWRRLETAITRIISVIIRSISGKDLANKNDSALEVQPVPINTETLSWFEAVCSDQITCKPCLQFLTLVRNNVVVWWNKCTTWTVQAELESTVSACGEAKTNIKQKERKVGVMRMPTDALTSVIQPFTHGLGHIKGQPLALRLRPDHPAVDVPLCWGGKIFVS